MTLVFLLFSFNTLRIEKLTNVLFLEGWRSVLMQVKGTEEHKRSAKGELNASSVLNKF